ncbi:MAG: glycerophosphoryl diester phosphodiesterase [Aliivibrio sp.]|uniref:glycerophosphodiester phosphodiesterase family protein n=1 Tax=Aliivibrio sp. TaxID=1872443 RepID=UPI001A4D9A0E|nr:glycerophosphoryl diester phosphodiesterase [Aliivibrio sp.]
MPPIIVGHRGVSGTHPENTNSSINRAIELGLRWVEIDVQPSKDGVLVVCHDHTIDRCSDGQGRVDAYTLQQLKQFDFGTWFSPEFSCEPILTLCELLDLAVKHDLNLNIEIKVDKHDSLKVVEQLKEQLDNSPIHRNNIILSSFNHEIMRQLCKYCPGYRLSVVTKKLTNQTRNLLAEVNAYGCHINYQWIRQQQINELKKGGYQVWCYTVNDAEKYSLLTEVDAIFTDYPERFISS